MRLCNVWQASFRMYAERSTRHRNQRRTPTYERRYCYLVNHHQNHCQQYSFRLAVVGVIQGPLEHTQCFEIVHLADRNYFSAVDYPARVDR